MARVSTYLNFPRNTEEAFNFYKSVFGTEFDGEIQRMGSVPPQEGQPPLKEEDKKLVMHIALPILGGHVLMGTDAPAESMGFKVKFGNNVCINLEPDTRAETDKLFKALSEGGKVEMKPQEMFWEIILDRLLINSVYNGCLIVQAKSRMGNFVMIKDT